MIGWHKQLVVVVAEVVIGTVMRSRVPVGQVDQEWPLFNTAWDLYLACYSKLLALL